MTRRRSGRERRERRARREAFASWGDIEETAPNEVNESAALDGRKGRSGATRTVRFDLDVPKKPSESCDYLALVEEILSESSKGLKSRDIVARGATKRHISTRCQTSATASIRHSIERVLREHEKADDHKRRIWLWRVGPCAGQIAKLWTLAGMDPEGRPCTTGPRTIVGGTTNDPWPAEGPLIDLNDSVVDHGDHGDSGTKRLPPPPGYTAKYETSLALSNGDRSDAPVSGDLLQVLEAGRECKRRVAESAKKADHLGRKLEVQETQHRVLRAKLDNIRGRRGGLVAELSQLECRRARVLEDLERANECEDKFKSELAKSTELMMQSRTEFETARKDLLEQQRIQKRVLGDLGLS